MGKNSSKSTRSASRACGRRDFLRLLAGPVALGLGGSLIQGCGSGRIEDDIDACEGITCSGHGTCVENGGTIRCDCDPGYHAEGFECVENHGDPCEGVGCSGHGQCVADDQGQPTCDCDSGYHAEGLECVEDGQDPCEGVGCSGHGQCTVDGQGKAECVCDEGYHAEGLECVEDGQDPCEGVGCSGHGQCTVDGQGKAKCLCDEGYHADGLECLPDGGCDAATLRAETLAHGTQILAGLTLSASTPIPDIEADPNAYAGKHIQVEGLVTSICWMGRNMAMLRDAQGNHIKIAGNFSVDLDAATGTGRYLVVEGVYSLGICRRGRHLMFGGHGALVGPTVCPV
jgi:hypothetical protein